MKFLFNMRRRYQPSKSFQNFLSKYKLPICKIAKICGMESYQLHAIALGYQKDNDSIRNKIRKGMLQYCSNLIDEEQKEQIKEKMSNKFLDK